ncbi:putative cytochrome P450 78A9 [Iris pallida]|uniref:Cytochrome P450 78A9 n=1 Tax=Iris pallida TaxID=29817 RepID=A0AAX6GCF7_IRIPA|nr:putative cytochrome P450 78A9 [Iris pallida]KAJ6826446.1 putative cytochrome P450 78A9 [Iris pallida]
MTTSMESVERWMLPLSLLAKCDASAPRLLVLSLMLVLVGLVTSLIHWTAPGGPAWGRYLSGGTRRTASIPGPRGLPFVGSMRLMSGLAHRSLAAAADRLGASRLMAVSLGGTRVVVTSHPDVAREILNSPAFADRPVKESAYGLLFHRAIGFAPHGPYWRSLRRVASAHLFCPKQISASGPHRAEIASDMVAELGRGSAAAGGVRVRDVLKRASLNNVMSSVFGKRYGVAAAESEEGEARELRGLVEEGYDLLGKLNWSDHLPWLAGLDLQRVRSRCAELVPKVNRFVSSIIAEHRNSAIGGEASDFVHVLLSLQGSDRLSDPDMVAVLWEMIFRGTDTVAVLIEWALARLVIHQDIQAKVHEELDRVVGKSRDVTESDSTSLLYLQAVIKEVLRTHPPGPLLSWARLSTSDVYVDGRLVPAGTTAMVNMWAITHDPTVWVDPLEFRPERFAGPSGSDFPILGSDLRLAPFGSGRRSCPGKALAMATVTFWMATLLHEYRWLPATATIDVDLSEVLRLSCEMANPLTVKLLPRRR